MTTYKTGDNDRKEINAAENALDDGYMSSSSSMSSFSSDPSRVSPSQTSESEVVEEEEEEDEDEDNPPLAAIIHAIHRLHRVAMAIRRSGMAAHDLKAAVEEFRDENGDNVIDIFRSWCLEILHHKFKTADEKTIQRIAHTNAERRRHFLYRKKHQKKLEGQRENIQASNIQTFAMSKSRDGVSTVIDPQPSTAPIKKSNARSIAHSKPTQLSQTTASKLRRSEYRDEVSVQSTMMSAAPSTQRLFDTSMYLPAPRVPPGAAEFYCPYCCRIHPAAERSGRRWKYHFLKDLSPYICLVEHCQDPNKLYADQQSWLKHMESHNMKYTCKQHPRAMHFSNATEFEQHVLDEHRHLSPAHLARLRSFNSTTAKLDICSCPICGFIPTKAPVPGKSVSGYQPAYQELIDHIANDLHCIAMWSLVADDDYDFDASSDASSRRVADERSFKREVASTMFDHDVDNIDPTDWPYHRFNDPKRSDDDTAPEPIPDGANPDDEWSFTRMDKSPYVGHDHDPKLKNFIRRLELEKLLNEGKTANPQLPCYYPSFNLPDEDFYGRESALERLEGSLHPSRATQCLRTMTVTGPAGIGKTKLALQYCQKFQNQYDVVLWVHADEESKLANDFVKIAVKLGFVSRDSPETRDQEYCRQLVKAWLSKPLTNINDPEQSDVASWLIVFDHITDPKIINDYWPSNAQSGSILITSRKPLPWSATKYPVLQLEPFNPEDSATFLSHLIQNGDVGNGALQLGFRALHSPVELHFLARMITSGRYSLKEFIQASQDNDGKKAILSLHTEDVTKNHASFSEWALESLSPKAAALLDAMAMLDPDSIVERMLKNPSDSIMIPHYPRDPTAFIEAKGELSNFSFISKDRRMGTLSIHRLLQDAALKAMSQEYYLTVFNSCIALINDRWPYQPFTWRHSVSRWPHCEELYPHVKKLRHFHKKITDGQNDIYGQYGYARLATDVAWYCHERGRSAEVSINWWQWFTYQLI
jgi:hypothetical protein